MGARSRNRRALLATPTPRVGPQFCAQALRAMLALPLLAIGWPVTAGRADEPVTLSKVPTAARQIAAERAPGVKFAKVLFDRGNKHYKLRGKDAKGRDVR